MRRSSVLFAVLALAVFARPSDAEAQWGIGFQSSWPAYGLSAVYDMSDEITLQAVLGAFGTWTNIGGRALYRFQQDTAYDLYGFGTVGMWRWSHADFSETAVGFGGGAGIEFDWQEIINPDEGTFPPIFTSIDIGFTVANWDTATGFNTLTLGVGFHYRFR